MNIRRYTRTILTYMNTGRHTWIRRTCMNKHRYTRRVQTDTKTRRRDESYISRLGYKRTRLIGRNRLKSTRLTLTDMNRLIYIRGRDWLI